MIAPRQDSSIPTHRRLLVVDDEPAVRSILRRYLGRQGWLVSEATSAEDALTMLDDVGSPIDAVIVDLNLPGLSGVDLCSRIAGSHPELARRMIVSSGDARHATSVLAEGTLCCRVLAKPFELYELDDVVAGMLAD